jgi:hypothetical protein
LLFLIEIQEIIILYIYIIFLYFIVNKFQINGFLSAQGPEGGQRQDREGQGRDRRQRHWEDGAAEVWQWDL